MFFVFAVSLHSRAEESHAGFLSSELPSVQSLSVANLTPPDNHMKPADIKMEPQLPLVPEVRRVDTLPSHMPHSDLHKQAISSSQINTRPLDMQRSEGICDIRIPEARLPLPVTDHRSLLPSNASFSYPGNTQTNLAILQESRSLTTHSVTSTNNYHPLLSPHSLLQGTTNASNTLATPSYLPTSPTTVFGSMSLYNQFYPSAQTTSSQYNHGVYIHTTEGRTLELLGNSAQNLRRACAITPVTSSSQQDDKDKSHMRLPHEPIEDVHESVWRPYYRE